MKHRAVTNPIETQRRQQMKARRQTETTYPCWVLILWGGAVPGERPRSRLAILLAAAKNGNHRGFTVKGNGEYGSKLPRVIEDSAIVHRFVGRARPLPEKVNRAKVGLAVTGRE